MAQFHRLMVADVRRETQEAVSIAFEVPPDLAADYRFLPGQYLTIRTQIDGQEARRSYSICTPPSERQLRIAVKRVAGGVFSGFANDMLEPGMMLDVMPPEGRFTAQPSARGRRCYVAFASGSGITPILSIVKTLLAEEEDSQFALFYGNRDRRSIMFREKLEDLKDLYLDRLTLVHVLSREGQDVNLLHGRLDTERIRHFAEVGLFDPKAADCIFVCGPGDMIPNIREVMESLGVEPNKIRFEQFTPADGAIPAKPSDAAQAAVERGVQIEARLDGAVHQFHMTKADETVIDAAHRQGIELPYSCKGGMCCTCRAKLTKGDAEMAINYSLEPWELEAGFVLGCQVRPLSDKIVLDFDEV